MPEGDTIFRAATRLRPLLEQQPIQEASSSKPQLAAGSLVGQVVTNVESRGKHLLIHFADGRVLNSHMGMTGSWHFYRHGEPWQKPERFAALVLKVPEWVVVCFTPKTLELLTAAALRRHPYLQRLGQDLLAGQVDAAETLRRFRTQDQRPIGEAIMNQSIVSGIGNVYKSEVLFITHVDPFAPVALVTDDELLKIVEVAQHWMKRNLDGHARRTRLAVAGKRQWVYGRSGERCFVCGTVIQMRRQGDLGRSTYWCAMCQPSRGAGGTN